MNFFDDDFGLGSTPIYSKKQSKGNLNTDQISRKSAKKDEYDDLLDDILSKEEKRSNKKRERQTIQPYSSTFLDPPPSNMLDFKKTQKWSTPNIEVDPFYQSPKFPFGKHPSIMDDRGSQEARSYKSGFTGRQHNLQLQNQITLRGDNIKDQIPVVQRSSRNMMKPPLRKRQSKQNLAKQQKQTSFWDDEPQINFSRRTPQISNLDLISNKQVRSKSRDNILSNDITSNARVQENKAKQKLIQKQKIITIREEAAELKRQFQNEVKEIRQSYERQLNLVQERVKTQAQEHKNNKAHLIKQYEEKLSQERARWQKLLSENSERLKEVHEWQLNRKSQAYEMEIQKIKTLSKFEDSIMKNQTAFHASQDNLELKNKQRQLKFEQQKLQEFKNHLEQRQKHLEFQQTQFNQYKKQQEEKLQLDRRLLYQKQNEIKKYQLQSKRNRALQKQQLASDLAESQLQIFRKKQALNLERQQLRSLRQIIEKEKRSYESFNSNILNDYKIKMREVETQKQHLNEMEIQIHKNIHILQMTEAQFKANQNTKLNRQISSNLQNQRNRSNTQLDRKLQETKGRFKEMQNFVRKNTAQTHQQRQRVKQKVNLSGYITRVNRALSKY